MDGIFVTGTDTGVGKTTVCAGLLKLLQGTRDVAYWKPVQTGTIIGDDTNTVRDLTELQDEYFIPPVYRFPDPVSPHAAAQKWGQRVELNVLTDAYVKAKKGGRFIIVEGAGGLLVPFNDEILQIDFISALKLPLLIVSEDRVGAINQSLLTVNAAREAGIEILGIVLTHARKTLGNAAPISQFGKVPVLDEIDPTESARNAVAQVGGSPRLRNLFKVSALPV